MFWEIYWVVRLWILCDGVIRSWRANILSLVSRASLLMRDDVLEMILLLFVLLMEWVRLSVRGHEVKEVLSVFLESTCFSTMGVVEEAFFSLLYSLCYKLHRWSLGEVKGLLLGWSMLGTNRDYLIKLQVLGEVLDWSLRLSIRSAIWNLLDRSNVLAYGLWMQNPLDFESHEENVKHGRCCYRSTCRAIRWLRCIVCISGPFDWLDYSSLVRRLGWCIFDQFIVKYCCLIVFNRCSRIPIDSVIRGTRIYLARLNEPCLQIPIYKIDICIQCLLMSCLLGAR